MLVISWLRRILGEQQTETIVLAVANPYSEQSDTDEQLEPVACCQVVVHHRTDRRKNLYTTPVTGVII